MRRTRPLRWRTDGCQDKRGGAPADGDPGRYGRGGLTLAAGPVVAAAGQLGVVSSVALDAVLARRLQCGYPDGDVRRALGQLPLPGVAERIVRRYFVPGGIKAGQPFRPVPQLGLRPNAAGTELTVAGNFVEVYLAKQGHNGLVGINYLEKIQLATIGLAQRRTDETAEPALITLGQNLDFLPELVAAAGTCFGAADVLAYLLQPARQWRGHRRR